MPDDHTTTDQETSAQKTEEYIKLDQFLKLAQIAATGGEAKQIIRAGMVRVNGDVETRRGRKLRHGDVVLVDGEELVVLTEADEDTSEAQEHGAE